MHFWSDSVSHSRTRALTPLLTQWCRLFLPYQNLAYLRSLLDFFTQLRVYGDATAYRKVYLFYLLYGVFALQNLYLWAFLPSPMDRLRQADLLSILVIQTGTPYLAVIALFAMGLYFMHVLCFTMKPPFLGLFEDTLFDDRHGTLEGVGYGTHSGQETARYIFISLANLLQGIMLVIDCILLALIFTIITTGLQSPGELFGSPLDTPLTFLWNVAWMILNIWTKATAAALYGKIVVNVCALGTGHLLLLFRRLYHAKALLVGYSRKEAPFSWAPFRQYLLYSGQTLRILFTANDTYSRLFVAFLVANMPISAWILVHLSQGSHSGSSATMLAVILVHELIVCILLHWATADFSKRLHAPSKTLLSLNATTRLRSLSNFRVRLLLHHTIVRLHTEAKYGVTYGSVGGLITMLTFAKCMILYTELVMYSYKLIQDI